MEKMTKKEMYNLIAEKCADNADIVDFCAAEVARLDAKAEKAKAKAAEKKTQGDELRAAVEAVLTEEVQLIDEIFAQVEAEGVTRAKVTNRLTQLVKAGIAVREEVKVEKSKALAIINKMNAEMQNVTLNAQQQIVAAQEKAKQDILSAQRDKEQR